MNEKPAVHGLKTNLGFRQIARNIQYALKSAVGNFQLMITPALCNHRIAPHAAHNHLVIGNQNLNIVGAHSGVLVAAEAIQPPTS